MVDFNPEWYNRFVTRTDEKDRLIEKIQALVKDKEGGSCLEIGLGTAPYFAARLSPQFGRYVIVEREPIDKQLPRGVELAHADWEQYRPPETFDVVLASHVVYYFKNKKTAMEKVLAVLSPGGKTIFVVNDTKGQYGALKKAFANMLGVPYRFTHDEVREILGKKQRREHLLTSRVRFSSHEELFETLRISFDNYPNDYERLKPEILAYMREHVPGNTFSINQRIIEIAK